MASTLARIAICFLLYLRWSSADDPCPFKSTCTCVKDAQAPSDPTAFQSAVCTNVDPSTTFDAPTGGGKYKIKEVFRLSGDVSKFADTRFASFESIGELYLEQTTGTIPVSRQWYSTAFNNVRLISLRLDGLGDLAQVMDKLPNTLERLSISKSSALRLTDKTFQSYLVLKGLEFRATKVDVDDTAFVGVSPSFQELTLADAKLQAVPTNALKSLPKLQKLTLSSNPISQVAAGSFDLLTSLTLLDLSDTAVSTVDLAIVPKTTEPLSVSLDKCKSLKSITLSIDPSAFPNMVLISAKATGLETVDPKIGELFTKRDTVGLNIADNVNLKCDTLKWMAPIATAERTKLQIPDAECASPDKCKGVFLSDYLEDIVASKEPCTDAPTQAPPTKAPGGSASTAFLTPLVMLITVLLGVFRRSA